MARKTKKRNSFPQASSGAPPRGAKAASAAEKPAEATGGQAVRETIESLVIAFVLAFLFRTFQAEAFVIPTGSMAPTLMGRHKDVDCVECGQRYKVNASDEALSDQELAERQVRGRSLLERRHAVDCVAGTCPSCARTMAMRPDLEPNVWRPDEQIPFQRSWTGDRIVVNKYLYQFTEPKRWDVVVFKYPGDANTNYIKRLVGLPEEELMIQHGDLFVRPAGSDGPYEIARKPPAKMLAMRQLVHDTDHDAARLHAAGWPLRWQADESGSAASWSAETEPQGRRLQQAYAVEAEAETAWLRYRHTPPSASEWAAVYQNPEALQQDVSNGVTPTLITDDNAYNSELKRQQVGGQRGALLGSPPNGLHWTGDLLVDADVEVLSGAGQLTLDLVEGGRHFTCGFDLSTGQATLGIRGFESQEPLAGFAPKASTSVREGTRRRLRFANVDDQLVLWVDGSLIKFDADTRYDPEQVFGSRDDIVPQTSSRDAGDLAPVGVGARDAAVTISRLQVWRDIYYIASSWRDRSPSPSIGVTDYPLDSRQRVQFDGGRAMVLDITSDPDLWPALRERRKVEFATAEDQFFVMGDNSAASLDCRLWKGGSGKNSGVPGGPYLERKLLIGKAVCVYWPHSWNRVPGTPIPFPLFPNFADMRLVR